MAMRTAALLLMMSLCAWAQADKARIVGTVTDASGAAIPNASITAKDERTGQERKIDSDDRGYYVIANLTPSTYTVTVKGNGLGPAQYAGVNLSVGQERNLNIILHPASLSS